jgi:cytochrome c biogenesis protein CcdA/thiol-disulfide isomerase/thioredoxin
MIIAVIAFLGGALTILSPCILPVLPFVFARTERSFPRSTLPLLVGMALTFAIIATLAAVGGGWAVRINAYGRVFALILLGAFGVALLSRRLADWIARPFVALGNRLIQGAGNNANAGILQSFVIGIATGFLWAPCAGPILGLILTGAAISGPNTQTTLLLFAYALGAITSLAIATRASTHLLVALKRSFSSGEWIRRALGIAVIVAVVVIGFGLDTGVLTRLSLTSTNHLEQSLLNILAPDNAIQNSDSSTVMSGAMTAGAMTDAMTGTMSNTMDGTMAGGAMMSNKAAVRDVTDEGELPALSGAVAWLNSPPLTSGSLRGKVVLIDFWTYSCINCLRALPYVKAWAERYKDHGLVVIGVHAPEFAFEKDENNVRRAVHDLGINYPIALDNNYAIWQAFNNRYWPAHYFIDAAGRIRGHHFGEGHYEESEQMIRQLLHEADAANLPVVAPTPLNGTAAAADTDNVKSPETYIGYERAENFGSPGELAHDQLKTYALPSTLQLNQWALSGSWIADKEKAVLNEASGKISYRFHARDLHLVLGSTGNKPIRFRVTIDGAAPAQDHGIDIDANGTGIVREQRLYQLIRQTGTPRECTFTIEFLDAGVQAYSFTFG